MYTKEFLDHITRYAKQYAPVGVASVLRNRHMNQITEESAPTQQQVEAVVVDFCNFMGGKCAIDLALYTQDLQRRKLAVVKERSKKKFGEFVSENFDVWLCDASGKVVDGQSDVKESEIEAYLNSVRHCYEIVPMKDLIYADVESWSVERIYQEAERLGCVPTVNNVWHAILRERGLEA